MRCASSSPCPLVRMECAGFEVARRTQLGSTICWLVYAPPPIPHLCVQVRSLMHMLGRKQTRHFTPSINEQAQAQLLVRLGHLQVCDGHAGARTVLASCHTSKCRLSHGG